MKIGKSLLVAVSSMNPCQDWVVANNFFDKFVTNPSLSFYSNTFQSEVEDFWEKETFLRKTVQRDQTGQLQNGISFIAHVLNKHD